METKRSRIAGSHSTPDSADILWSGQHKDALVGGVCEFAAACRNLSFFSGVAKNWPLASGPRKDTSSRENRARRNRGCVKGTCQLRTGSSKRYEDKMKGNRKDCST